MSQGEAANVGTPTSFSVEGPLTDEQIKIDKIEMWGARIHASDVQLTDLKTLEAHNLYDYHKRSGSGFSTNIVENLSNSKLVLSGEDHQAMHRSAIISRYKVHFII